MTVTPISKLREKIIAPIVIDQPNTTIPSSLTRYENTFTVSDNTVGGVSLKLDLHDNGANLGGSIK